MARIITNNASVTYLSGESTATAFSNVASTVINGNLSITKSALPSVYRSGDVITYIITLVNSGITGVSDIAVSDDLGAYTLEGNRYAPLSILGNAELYENGLYQRDIVPAATDEGVAFLVGDISSGDNLQIIYQARVNEFACTESGALIINTATVSGCDCPCVGDLGESASATITADEYADVRIIKSICPNPAICGEELSFNFDIFNYGNVPATNVVLTDTFSPPISDLSVFLNGNVVTPNNYSYENGTLTFPVATSDISITVPAAQCVQNDVTGVVTVTPGSVRITVTGII